MNSYMYYKEVKTLKSVTARRSSVNVVVYVGEGWPVITTETIRQVKVTAAVQKLQEEV